MANNTDDTLNERVSFIQHQLPGLDVGAYQLTVAQSVKTSSGAPVSDDSLTNTYAFAVQGDRFAIGNPANLLYAVFPADNDTGEFSTVLPHVVFNKKTFPWIRHPNATEPSAPTPLGGDVDADVPTWLAVLLLDEDDLTQFPALALTPQGATVGDLFPPKVYSASSLGKNISYFRNATGIASELEFGEQPTDAIRVIDLPLLLFWQVAPTLNDLSLLAHARQVSLINKPTSPGVSDVGEPTGDFSIVFGNRLPQTQKKAYAYLVSLEGMQDLLPTDEGGPPPGWQINDTRSIRLAVLKSWAFFSTGETASFTDRVLGLNGRDPDGKTDAVNTNLRLPYAGDNPVVRQALSMGYVPLNHNLRTGGKTVSWYRGPLATYEITNQRVNLPIASPDQATLFDPTTGMFDTSYATAWTLGRLLALQDKGFSTALYNWKRGMSQQVLAAVEDGLIQEKFDQLLNDGAQPTALKGIEVAPATEALRQKLMRAIARQK